MDQRQHHYYCKAGLIHADAGLPCEDAVTMGLEWAAVMDGHGVGAVEMVARVRAWMDAYGVSTPETAMQQAGALVKEDDEAAHEAGLTLTVCKWTYTGSGDGDVRIDVAHVGDSLAAILSTHTTNTADWSLEPLTIAHRLSTSSERERVQRVNPGVTDDNDDYIVHPDDVGKDWPRVLALTRTLGDFSFDSHTSGVLREPECTTREIRKHPDRRYFLVVATDGLWDLVPTMNSLCQHWSALVPSTGSQGHLVLQTRDFLDGLLAMVDELGGHEDDLGVVVCEL